MAMRLKELFLLRLSPRFDWVKLKTGSASKVCALAGAWCARDSAGPWLGAFHRTWDQLARLCTTAKLWGVYTGLSNGLGPGLSKGLCSTCEISGTIDFIFGHGKAFIQDSKIILRKPDDNQWNTVTADGRLSKKNNTGLVIQNCEIVPEPQLLPERFKVKSYLERPWKADALTVIMESSIGEVIQPEGWTPWDKTHAQLDTSFLAEYNNRRPGANTNRRLNVRGFRDINRKKASTFTDEQFSHESPVLTSTS
ncbi:Pectinesterase [Quillaja saponaria]|uniref:Pectinesterase n=1 Tax=Quillaja saponaria TaxID=32244 RepID=A0AAD7QA20_QUISA|nr:Pectinesterase [Quillaja saponaria]